MMKRIYNQPEVQVTSVTLTATILTGSGVSTPSVSVNTGIPTNNQW